MYNFLVGFVLLFLLAAAGALGFFYWQFRHSPNCLWRNRVRRHLAELQARILPTDFPTDTQAKGLKLGETLFDQQLKAMPSSAIMGFAGIGPGTADRLQSAGLLTLTSLMGYDFTRIPGFGPAKASEVRIAVEKALKDARAKFEAGASAEGQAYRRRWAEMIAADQAERDTRTRTNAACERTIAALQPQLQLASAVTFWNHLLHKGHVPGLTDDVMNRPLPELVIEPPAIVPVMKPVAPEVRIAEPVLAAKPAPVFKPVAVDPFRSTLPPQPATPSAEHPQLPKLRAYCAFALMVAKADGKIAKAERAKVRDLLASSFGHDSTLLRFLDPVMEQIEKAIPDEDDAVAAVVKLTTPDERRMLYKVAESIADSSGERGAREVDALRRMAKTLGVSDVATSFQLVDKSPPLETGRQVGNLSPRQILEIDPAASLSVELIRRRFTLLTEKADPAKAAALGAEFVRMAETKRADILRAAQELMAPFGEPLVPPAAPPKPSDTRHNPDLDDVFGA